MTVWRRAPRVLWRRSGARVVIDCPGPGEPLLFEGTAAELWRLLEHQQDAAQLSSTLAASYGVETSDVRQDIDDFLDQLRAVGAVVLE